MQEFFETELAHSDDKISQRIISHARRVFMERGFRRVTIEELCAGIAMSKRTFYKSFKNRDELVRAVLLNAAAPDVLAMVSNLTSDVPVPQILHKHFELIINGFFRNITLPFLNDLQTLMPELWTEIEERRTVIIELLAALIKRGQGEGAINPNLDPAHFSKVVDAILRALANPQAAMSMGLSLQQVAATMRSFILEGVLIPPAKGK